MTNSRHPVHMHERVATAPLRVGAASVRTCAVPGCGPAVGVLCDAHWFSLPWSVRNSVGAASSPPLHASKAQIRALKKALKEALLEAHREEMPTLRASTPLSPSEKRFKPAALRILEEYGERPKTTTECDNRGRQMPCPYVSCSRHLYLDVQPNGSLHFNFPGREVWELEETCWGEVVRKHPEGMTPRQAGKLVGLSKARAGQIERMYRLECERRGLSPKS